VTADDTTPARVAAAAEALRLAFSGDEFEENAAAAAGEGEWSWFRWLAVSTVEALDAKPGDAEQAGGLTDAEDAFWREKEAGRCKSDRGGYYHDGFIDGFLAARAAGGPDDGTAERARSAAVMARADALRAALSDDPQEFGEFVKRVNSVYRAAADTGHQGGES